MSIEVLMAVNVKIVVIGIWCHLVL